MRPGLCGCKPAASVRPGSGTRLHCVCPAAVQKRELESSSARSLAKGSSQPRLQSVASAPSSPGHYTCWQDTTSSLGSRGCPRDVGQWPGEEGGGRRASRLMISDLEPSTHSESRSVTPQQFLRACRVDESALASALLVTWVRSGLSLSLMHHTTVCLFQHLP